jgi:uncharacterized protein
MFLRRLRLIPRGERFFELFNRSAENVLEGAQALRDLLEHYEDVDRKTRRLKDLEHQGDELTHQILRALARTFVTPLDREDISQLAGALDDVLDWTEDVARRMHTYHVDRPTVLAQQLGRVLADQAVVISRAVPLLEDLRQSEAIDRAVVEIHRLENEADDLTVEALGSLYDGATDIPTLVQRIHWGDLYETLEEATDRASTVANVLQNISLKHA